MVIFFFTAKWHIDQGLVSNSVVISVLRKCLSYSAIGIGLLLFLVIIASQVEQRIFRRRAEALLSQVQSLELRRTPWLEARYRLKPWARESKVNDECNGSECSVQITVFEAVYGFAYKSPFFVHWDDYVRWKFKLSFDEGPFVRIEQALIKGYMLIGGRPGRVTATAGMRDGIVWSKGYSVNIETYWHKIPEFNSDCWFEYPLMAETISITQPEITAGIWANDPQIYLHPNYVISRPGGCEICIDGYVHFTPYTNSADIRRLMQLNLSCFTQLRPCVDQNDIMPAAWKQYLAEHHHK